MANISVAVLKGKMLVNSLEIKLFPLKKIAGVLQVVCLGLSAPYYGISAAVGTQQEGVPMFVTGLWCDFVTIQVHQSGRISVKIPMRSVINTFVHFSHTV